MPSADVNGTSLYFETLGSGPTCLVLHGGLGLDHTFYRSLDRLAERMRLVHFDQRGNGRSGRPARDTITMEQLADDCADLGRQLDPAPTVVLGHSYGGFVAQELALRHPDRVAALVLIATTPGQRGTTEDPAADQGPRPPAEIAELLSRLPTSDDELEAGMKRLLGLYLHQADPACLEPLLSDTIFVADAAVRGFEVLASWSAFDRLGSISAPTLVVVGSHDSVTSPDQARRIASRIPGAQLAVVEESGHMPWIDEPDATFAILESWLDTMLPAP